MIVVYASSHGWGHNVRISAIIDQLWNYSVEFVTTCPHYLIESSLRKKRVKPIVFRNLLTDPGCVQNGPFNIDIEKTVEIWKKTREEEEGKVNDEVEYLRKKGNIRMIISDISYFGQLVAEKLSVPSVCVATFDWEFIYKDYLGNNSELNDIISHVMDVSRRFDYCLVPGTICKPLKIGKKQMYFHWSSRKPLMPKSEMRKKLGLDLYQDSILLSFGGHTLKIVNKSVWEKFENYQFFVLVPQKDLIEPPAPNVHLLSCEEWSKYHADLVNTVDIVFGKLGYGLVSEVINSKTSFLSVERNGNPEYNILRDQVKIIVPFEEIKEEDYLNGNWYALNRLIEINRESGEYSDVPVDGEVKIADQIRNILGDRKPLDINLRKYAIHILILSIIIYILFFRTK